MRTDRIDILPLYRPDALGEPEEVARAFDELESSGKVRAFGVSNQTPRQIDLLRRYVRQPSWPTSFSSRSHTRRSSLKGSLRTCLRSSSRPPSTGEGSSTTAV
ncbi:MULTISPECIES: aldo/keto reductase [Streptomyces violaceusniger group]|uniref:aldo/keto reductase n=1 Tax=Streptomyces javensis TaxID=114698 RepID=UPI001FE3740C|nr:aldo/keto reductase [Streptomyces javensis]